MPEDFRFFEWIVVDDIVKIVCYVLVKSWEEIVNEFDDVKSFENKKKIVILNKFGAQSSNKMSQNNLNNSVKKNHRYPCDQCNFSAKGPSKLKTHVDSVHLKIKHRCEQCGKELASKRGLSQHVNAVHSLERPH